MLHSFCLEWEGVDAYARDASQLIRDALQELDHKIVGHLDLYFVREGGHHWITTPQTGQPLKVEAKLNRPLSEEIAAAYYMAHWYVTKILIGTYHYDIPDQPARVRLDFTSEGTDVTPQADRALWARLLLPFHGPPWIITPPETPSHGE